MPFVKLDCELLESSLWDWTPERHLFITALLMARPRTIDHSMFQIQVDSLKETGWSVPPGKYGFVNASGSMIIKKALGISHVEMLEGEGNEDYTDALLALAALGMPDKDSRSQAFDGRRLVRVDGGYIVLNYNRFRDKDHTATERKQRQRANESQSVTAVTSVKSRHVTEEEAESDADAKTEAERPSSDFFLPDVQSFLTQLIASGRYVDPEGEFRRMQKGSGKLTLAHFKNILKKRPLTERPPEVASPSYEETF